MDKKEFLEKSCGVPFLTLSTFSNGRYHPCCWIDQPYVDDEGRQFDFNVDSPSDVYHSEDAVRTRQEFLTTGACRPECESTCFAAERAGGESKRISMFKYMFHDSIVDDILSGKITFPKLIEVKLTNLCNLRCKTCIPEHSSSIMSEFQPKDERDEQRIIVIKKAYDLYLKSRGAVFLDSIIENIEVIEWIEFYGGEPFMIKDHKKFLQRIVDSGYAKNITLSYTTNGTKYDAAYIDLFKQFKGVVISLSIDGIGELNDEIRVGSKWEDIEANLKKYIEMKEQGVITSLNVNSTISMYNIHGVMDLVRYFEPIDC